MRYSAVLQRMTHDDDLAKYAVDGLRSIIKFHGARSGTIIADEHLAGLSPQRGYGVVLHYIFTIIANSLFRSELCTAVELMFSYAYLYRFYGDNKFADQAELVAFNALPAAISPDCSSQSP